MLTVNLRGMFFGMFISCFLLKGKTCFYVFYSQVNVFIIYVLYCVICVFCLLVVLVRLSVGLPVQVIDWKNSSLK